jgi:SAM-dependent methyltransferase
MRLMDRVLQRWRARVARPWVRRGARILDIGCHQGEFLESLGDRIGPSVGLDPLACEVSRPRYRLRPELFPVPSPFADGEFDVVVMLATLEHVHDKEPLAQELFRVLSPGGRVIITVPAPWVDWIVHSLCRLGVADGMSLEEHHGFDPATTPEIFARPGFTLERWRRFQLGANHLLVFRKPSATGEVLSPSWRSAAQV